MKVFPFEEIYFKKMDNEIYLKYGEFETTTDEVLEESIRVSTEAYDLEKDEIAVIMCNMPLTDTKTRVNMMKIHTIE